ncbi:hypothetical protein [uncultured Methylophaga sp.]|uniref:hypothetical protein n=1 Tax=uncultured Methylophaga sp. TaxID=285271 RepID=UPI00262C8F11|nr:hypothetical protein [uncultured Methylophaga sp.]
MPSVNNIMESALEFLGQFDEALKSPGRDYKDLCFIDYSMGLVGNHYLTVRDSTKINEDALQSLISEVESNILAYDTCVELFERLARKNLRIPMPLVDTISKMARNDLKRPTPRGRKTKYYQHRIIRSAIGHLASEYEMPIYHSSDKDSVCSVVKEALERLGIYLSYDQLVDIYKGKTQTRKPPGTS